MPLLIGVRHVHIDDDLLAILVDHRRQVRGMQTAAQPGGQHREIVLPHEREQLGAVFEPVIFRRVHYSSSATACAAIPSTRPMKPMPSVVVALMLTIAGVMPRSAAMLPIMRGMCGDMRGSWAMMVASILTTRSFCWMSFFATSRRSLRL